VWCTLGLLCPPAMPWQVLEVISQCVEVASRLAVAAARSSGGAGEVSAILNPVLPQVSTQMGMCMCNVHVQCACLCGCALGTRIGGGDPHIAERAVRSTCTCVDFRVCDARYGQG